MEINLTLHGILRDYLPRQNKGRSRLTLPDGTTVSEGGEQLKIKQTVSAAVNGVKVDPEYVLNHEDDLQMFRMIGGG